MTQTTDPRPEPWGSGWASPTPAGQPQPEGVSAAQDATQAQPAGAAEGAGSEQYPAPGQTIGYLSAGYPAPAPAAPNDPDTQPTQTLPNDPVNPWAVPPAPPGQGGSGGRAPREPRRPGWGGVVAIGAGAAVLSSLLTAGVLTQTGVLKTSSDSTSSSGSGSGVSTASNLGASSAPVTGSSASNPDWVAVAKAVEPSVVSVQVSGQSGSGEGSGIVIDTKGHVLTNNHVVADASGGGTITVVLSDGRGYPATVVGTDPTTDLAVIQIKNAPSDLKPAAFGASANVRVGDQVMAIGNPLGFADTVTTGIVSALNRPVTTTSSDSQNQFGGSSSAAQQVVTNAIQTDAAINPGNSGGALVDSQGRVIGITSSIASLGSSVGSSQSGSIGLGFAIPIDEAKDVASQLIATGKAQHAWLGISLQDGTVSVNGAQRQAAMVGQVQSGTPASKAGLKAGDAVTAINGVAVDGADSLVGEIRAMHPGTQVTLSVVRNGSAMDIKVTLGTKTS